MTALFTMDDKIYIGKSENYDNKGHYDNTDNSLLYVSDCQHAFTFLTSEGCIYPQDEALKKGIYTQEDYKEFSRMSNSFFLSKSDRNLYLGCFVMSNLSLKKGRAPRTCKIHLPPSMTDISSWLISSLPNFW